MKGYITILREPNLAEVTLENTFADIEFGTELLDLRILEASKQAALLVKDLVTLQDS